MALIGKTIKELHEEQEANYKKMKRYAENRDVAKYTVNIPAHIFVKAKVKLARERKSMKSIFVEALEKYLSKDEKN